MAEAAVEAAGQALLEAPLQAANHVPQLLAKLAEPSAHDKVSSETLLYQARGRHGDLIRGAAMVLVRCTCGMAL
jgi:hypothetical protein